MVDGVRLKVFIGPVVPLPVPAAVLDALVSVEVTEGVADAGLFQLTFALSPRSPLHTLFLLTGGSSVPLVRVVLAVEAGGRTEVLIDGVMTHHQVTSGGPGRPPALTVTGEDLTRVMDYQAFNGLPLPGMPIEARVLFLLAKYAPLGVIPKVVPSVMVDVPIPLLEIPRQEGTDLEYIRQLANEVGYVFYLEPGPAVGASLAYWGPMVKIGAPQPALSTDWDGATNVTAMSGSYDPDCRELPVIYIQDEVTKLAFPVPIPDISPLNPPLGLVSAPPKRIHPLPQTAKLSPTRAALLGLAEAARSASGVSVVGTLDVARYGRVLRSRRLVGARGLGPAFDGLYHVESVTHRIKRGEYAQAFTLRRNGLLSTVPRIPA